MMPLKNIIQSLREQGHAFLAMAENIERLCGIYESDGDMSSTSSCDIEMNPDIVDILCGAMGESISIPELAKNEECDEGAVRRLILSKDNYRKFHHFKNGKIRTRKEFFPT